MTPGMPEICNHRLRLSRPGPRAEAREALTGRDNLAAVRRARHRARQLTGPLRRPGRPLGEPARQSVVPGFGGVCVIWRVAVIRPGEHAGRRATGPRSAPGQAMCRGSPRCVSTRAASGWPRPAGTGPCASGTRPRARRNWCCCRSGNAGRRRRPTVPFANTAMPPGWSGLRPGCPASGRPAREPVPRHLHRHRPLELPVGGSPHIAHGPGTKNLLKDVSPGKFGPRLHSGSPV
jgi:hypothetical protein